MTTSAERESPDVTGLDWTALDTPALLVDLDRLDANIDWMAAHARDGGVALWPHFKTHKSVAIARRQLDAGAVGITVAKLDESETLVDGGSTRRSSSRSRSCPHPSSRGQSGSPAACR